MTFDIRGYRIRVNFLAARFAQEIRPQRTFATRTTSRGIENPDEFLLAVGAAINRGRQDFGVRERGAAHVPPPNGSQPRSPSAWRREAVGPAHRIETPEDLSFAIRTAVPRRRRAPIGASAPPLLSQAASMFLRSPASPTTDAPGPAQAWLRLYCVLPRAADLGGLQPGASHQEKGPGAEGSREADHGLDREVLPPALDVLQVAVADPGGLAELLLGEPEFNASTADVRGDGPQLSLDIGVAHPRSDTLPRFA
jgi:hypothetical protein